MTLVTGRSVTIYGISRDVQFPYQRLQNILIDTIIQTPTSDYLLDYIVN